ncbi:MAG: tRNA(Ile)(2)-agmatinylcytidine synthase [Methanobacteriota archaeon]
MCTTFLLTELVREFSELDVVGYPRLVRLNPQIPWKTRGNAALSVALGKGHGRKTLVGNVAGKDVFAFARGTHAKASEEYLARAKSVLDKWAVIGEEMTNPGLVVLDKKPPASFYWMAVREVVPIVEGRKLASKGLFTVRGNGRGLVGACASVAWRPRDRTYEVIAYRGCGMWGTPRRVIPESVSEMDKAFPSTFNNYDYAEDKVVLAPGSPCPILFGIRGDDPKALPEAMRALKGEKFDRWLIYESNQGTDDHLLAARVADVRPFSSATISGTIASEPRTIPGGHVIARVRDSSGEIDVAVYEPAKGFRKVLRALVPGDRLVVSGGVREKPLTLNVEKIQVLKLAVMKRKTANPRCAKCDKAMKSEGKGMGFRCERCGAKAGKRAGTYEIAPRPLTTGWYEPPACARRHLAKPLKRTDWKLGKCLA